MKKTVLNDWHNDHGAKMFEFAGWEMPVHYGDGILSEHQQVRKNAGLFDLGHMGLLQVSGQDARHFLDLISTNYASWLEDGEAQYSFILTPEAEVLDDLLLYRRSETDFFMVVNAANTEKIKDWLFTVQKGDAPIDPEREHTKWTGSVRIRDMKNGSESRTEPSERTANSNESTRPEKQDNRLNIALQGSKSFAILNEAIQNDTALRKIDNLKRFEFFEYEIDGWNVIISRTGYTGESDGYELYVDPNDAEEFWTYLLHKGESHGLVPVGLGARDTLRIEAGLPLHGHELAGDHDITPFGSGYAPFVKWHKPFFIGREALKEKENNRTHKVVRFKTGSSGRPIREGDIVTTQDGTKLGDVTSTLVKRNKQIGLAYVRKDEGDPGNTFYVLSNRTIQKRLDSPSNISESFVREHAREATVLSRFLTSGEEAVSWGEDE